MFQLLELREFFFGGWGLEGGDFTMKRGSFATDYVDYHGRGCMLHPGCNSQSFSQFAPESGWLEDDSFPFKMVTSQGSC